MTNLSQKSNLSKTSNSNTQNSKVETAFFNNTVQVRKEALTTSKPCFENKLKTQQNRAKAKNLGSVIALKCINNCEFDFQKKEFWRIYNCTETITQ